VALKVGAGYIFNDMARRSTRARRRGALAASAAAVLLASAVLADEVSLGHAIGGVCPDCDFAGRDLHGASIVGNLPRTDFSGAILTNARLGGNFAFATLAGADLTNASIESANFVNSDLSRAKLDGARINGSSFFAVALTGATLRSIDASWSNFSASNFLGAKLDDAVLNAVKLARADFTRAELPRATLIGADLGGARFEDAILTDANLSGVNATDAAFPGADLSGATLEGAVLNGADLRSVIGLTAAALASACGDSDTRLPEGLSVAACPAQGAGTGARGGFAPVEAAGSAPAWSFPFSASPGPQQLEAVLADSDSARRAVRRLMDAQSALATAYEASHTDLDLSLRDAIEAARDVVAGLTIAEIAASDAEVTSVIESIDRIRPEIESPAVRDALQTARASLDGVLVEMTDVREQLQAAANTALVGSIEQERARRNARLDRGFALESRQLDREIDARLRALDAECASDLSDLEGESEGLAARLAAATREDKPTIERAVADLAGRRGALESDCAEREGVILEERRQRLNALDAQIAEERSRIEADLAALIERSTPAPDAEN
jgi:uncharacterized protein YjbI with pentapeptide repeats